MEENAAFGFLPPLIEVPADVLLYWTLRSVNFKGVVTEQDINKYHEAICKSYQKFKGNIEESLAFNYPGGNNFQREVFEEVILKDGKSAFKLRRVEGRTSKELLEFRLSRMESFERMQKPVVREMFSLAAQFYKMSQPPVMHYQEKPTMKQKVLTLASKLKRKKK